MIQIYDTKKSCKVAFKPLNSKQVGIYVCGMTVYDLCHIGHARIMIVFDVVVRHLRVLYPNLTYVRNITDIDDKIIKKALDEGISFFAISKRFIDAMHADEAVLGVLTPDIEPRASEAINSILKLIEELVNKKLAYQDKHGDVRFAVRKFPDYGALSGKDLDTLRSSVRMSKKNLLDNTNDPLDFVLWKRSKAGEPSWPSPWGDGRPGWHIECSAMSMKHLGNHFDIHGGGMDLVFPHHENELAQSAGARKTAFVNTWMHVGFVNVETKKMSKSLGNFFTIREVLKVYSGEEIRYFILASHYRSPLNYSEENLNLARKNLNRLYRALKSLTTTDCEQPHEETFNERFMSALDDDFNTPLALSVLFELAKHIQNLDESKQTPWCLLLRKLGNHIGILQEDPLQYLKGDDLDEQMIETKIKERKMAREAKDFVKADQIREELLALGIVLEDEAGLTVWRRA